MSDKAMNRLVRDANTEPLRRRIVVLMARDKRWRSADDIARDLKVPAKAASNALGKLSHMGILDKEDACGVRIYRKAGA